MTYRVKLVMAGLIAVLFLCAPLSSMATAYSPSDRGRTIYYDPSKAYNGYTLFNPNGDYNTYLIDMYGNTAHTWLNAKRGGYSVYLLKNGHLMRAGEDSTAVMKGAAFSGLLQEIDWNATVVWEFKYSTVIHNMHHDIEPMPNGNVLIVAWDKKTATEIVDAGYRRSTEMWVDSVIEVNRTTSSIQWEWHAWDHLIQDYNSAKANYGVIANHPELLNINLAMVGGGPGPGDLDWLHTNAVSYNPILDQIVLCSHNMDELYIIDHSTSTIEAKGHTGGNSGKGGDILYRWGKPSNYKVTIPPQLDMCHCALWIEKGLPGEGNIMVFNNGDTLKQSSIYEITPPVATNGSYEFVPGVGYGPSSPLWSYSNGSNFYSVHLGSNQRLPNGNTLISESTKSHLLEVTSTGEVVWEFQFGKEIARSLRYAPNYPGLPHLVPETGSVLIITVTVIFAIVPAIIWRRIKYR